MRAEIEAERPSWRRRRRTITAIASGCGSVSRGRQRRGPRLRAARADPVPRDPAARRQAARQGPDRDIRLVRRGRSRRRSSGCARSRASATPPSPSSRSCRRPPAASRAARSSKRPVLSSWSSVLDYCRTAMAFADKEQFRILFLDKRNQLIADEVQQTGTVDHTPVYPREVVKRALELSATAIILVHNHPVRRSDAVARRHPDDAGDRRGGEAARHCRARPHHRRQGRPCELEGTEADIDDVHETFLAIEELPR